MPKRYSSETFVKVLKKTGFLYISQKGSHVKFRKKDKTVFIPADRKEIPVGTFHSIVRQSGLTEETFAGK